jgi:hypothetical protein
MADYANFRQQLDAVLRTRDVKQVRNFLIAEEQWSEELPADPEFAMWMMIAGSKTLRDLHEQASKWLVSHGHGDDAEAVLRKGKGSGDKQRKKGRSGDSQGKHR